MPLVQTEANALLAASTTQTTYPNTTASRLALDTANGTATAAGTEVTGGSYTRQAAAFGAAASGAISNNAAITFSGMPACTVTGCELYDSAGTPNRKWYGALTTSRTLLAGDSLTFAIGALQLTLT